MSVPKQPIDRSNMKLDLKPCDATKKPFSGNEKHFDGRHKNEEAFLEKLKQMKVDIQQEVKGLHRRMDSIDFHLDGIVNVVKNSFLR